MTDLKNKEAAAPEPLELSQEELGQVLKGELDIDALIAEAQRRSPLPTLESVRAEIVQWKESWHTNLRICHENRVKLRAGSAAQTVLLSLHQRDFAAVRRSIMAQQGDDPMREIVEGLTDEELEQFVIMKTWSAPAVAAAIGLYVGACLVAMEPSLFNLDEVCRLAADPVFMQYAIMGKLEQTSASGIALMCLKAIRHSDSLG